MQVYNKVIETTNKLLSNHDVRELDLNDKKNWNMLTENEFLLRRDIAFELGIRTKPSTCFNAVTSDDSLVGEDKVLLIGPDIPEIKEDVTFTRITFLNVDNIDDPNKAYQSIKKLEFARFKIIPEGYMVLSSSMDNKEHVRVSKKAVENGLNFATIGNMIIDKYKKDLNVNHAQVIFITKEIPEIEKLVEQGEKVDEITNAFDHILKNIILDCAVCPLNKICDEVEALRKIHFDTNNAQEAKV